MEKFDSTEMDQALEKLLKRATDPAIPEGAQARLMAAIRAAEQHSNVVPFQPRAGLQRWAVGLPLAASLALGIYVGSQGLLDNYFPDSVIDAALADTSEPAPSSGLDDAESYEEGELT